MSAKIAGLVWELDLPREHKYVLLCLSDHSDHDGNNVFPSIGLVAWKTGYSERRIQELMRNLEYRGLLVRMDSQSGRGRTIRYRINLEAGVFRERPKKGARLSPFSRMTILRNSEIPQAKKGASGDEKGERAAAPESSRTRTIQSTPPTPHRGVSDLWQQVSFFLKDDLNAAYVNSPNFHESAYDKYFRDAWLVEIEGDVAILDSVSPGLLREGVEKFQKRLQDIFRGVIYDISAVRVINTRPCPESPA